MHYKIRCFFVLAVLCGCKINKEKTEQQYFERQQAYSNFQQRQLADFRIMDSIGRYWTFSTDSLFYYHPDSGLRGSRGELSLWEDKLHKQSWTLAVDSNRVESTDQEQYRIWKQYYRKVKDSKWMMTVSTLLVLGIGFLLYRFVLRFIK